jgi:hypothetical protein
MEAEIGKKLSKQALEEVANLVKPDTILAWYRKLVAQKFDGSKHRQSLGRPRIDPELEELMLRMAERTAAGAMTALWVPWPISGTPSVTRPWATFSSGMTFRLLPSARKPQRGKSLSTPAWMS